MERSTDKRQISKKLLIFLMQPVRKNSGSKKKHRFSNKIKITFR